MTEQSVACYYRCLRVLKNKHQLIDSVARIPQLQRSRVLVFTQTTDLLGFIFGFDFGCLLCGGWI